MLHKAIETYDVTDQFTDPEGRLAVAINARDRLYALLKKIEDVKERRLETTNVTKRLRKLIAYQSHVPLNEVPHNYKNYLEMIHKRGADMLINKGFNIVLGKSDKLLNANPGFEYVRPVIYAELAQIIAESETYISY